MLVKLVPNMPIHNESKSQTHHSNAELILRRHPLSHNLPYALDLHCLGLHCLFPRLNGPIALYPDLLSFLPILETLTSPSGVNRELEIIRLAYANAHIVGPVYDIPTVPGWAVMQKIARTDLHLQGLLGSTSTVYSVPKDLASFDDIRPDLDALPEVSPYTQIAAILYEALDALTLTSKPSSDPHLRNLYPHAVWSSGVVYSQGQARRLAAIAPPPRVFSRWLECPITGEILAIPGVVRRDGWLTLFQALVPTNLEGGVSFEKGPFERFVPRSSMGQEPVAASVLIEQLTFAELYYLIRIEEIGSSGNVQAVLHETNKFENTSLGLVDQFLDKSAFCQSRDIRVERKVETGFSQLEALAKLAKDENRALACAEQEMCRALSAEDEVESIKDDLNATLVYKQDVRIDFALLDGYDGWTDEELSQKKNKAWTRYSPQVLLPVEVNALFVDRGVQFYCVDGGARILSTNSGEHNRYARDTKEVFVYDGVTWTELRCLLENHGPDLCNSADRLLISLLVAGHVRLYGYYYCADAGEGRHVSRSLGVFMDSPLHVLGYKVPGRVLSSLENGKDCLIIPVGPACTILMHHVTERTSKWHGTVYHSEKVTVLPYGCRLGDRSCLQWYQVGAGPWEASDHPPYTLVEMADSILSSLSCTSSCERDHVLISAQKGLKSVRLRDIGFEAGWTGFSPHLLITGKGKRITTAVKAHSLTHVIEVLRRIRDSKRVELQHSIQEIAGIVVLKEVLIGGLAVMGDPRCLHWSPTWKRSDQGFSIAHAISLPRGVGVRQIDLERLGAEDNCAGLLISRDTMAVFRECGQVEGVWKMVFVKLDANIESEKLLIGPEFEGFVLRVCAGKMGAS